MTDMSLFIDTKFKDAAAFQDFVFANSQDHTLIATALQKKGIMIQQFPIADVGNLQIWLAIHASMHDAELSNLGLDTGVDLSDVDFNVESEYRDWQQQHSLLHQYEKQALGLS